MNTCGSNDGTVRPNATRGTVVVTVVILGSVLTAFAPSVAAGHGCAHPDALFEGQVALGGAPAGGEPHWYRLEAARPTGIHVFASGSETSFQVFRNDCTSGPICTATSLSPSALAESCVVNAGLWRINVWSQGDASSYMLITRPAA